MIIIAVMRSGRPNKNSTDEYLFLNFLSSVVSKLLFALVLSPLIKNPESIPANSNEITQIPPVTFIANPQSLKMPKNKAITTPRVVPIIKFLIVIIPLM